MKRNLIIIITSLLLVNNLVWTLATAEENLLKDDFNKFDSNLWVVDPPGSTHIKDDIISLKTENATIHVTSKTQFRFATLETKIRISTSVQIKRYQYIGFLTREPWADSGCFAMTDGNNIFTLKTRKNSGDWHSDIAVTGELEQNKWYTIKIVWSVNRIEMFLDDKSCGFSEDAQKIPDNFMPAIIDVLSSGAGETGLDMDWVKISYVGKQSQSEITSVLKLPRKIPPFDQGVLKDITPLITVKGDEIFLENKYYLYEISLQRGIYIKKIVNKYTGKDCLNSSEGSRIFSINIQDKRMDSTDFSITDIRTSNDRKEVNILFSSKDNLILARLNIGVDDSPETRWSLGVHNKGDKTIKAKATFPLVENIKHGDNIEDNYYFFPFQSGWVGNIPCDIRVEYGLHAWMQVIDTFNSDTGGGIYTWVEDDTGEIKTLILRKVGEDNKILVRYQPLYLQGNNPGNIFSQNEGVTMAVQQVEEEIQPKSEFDFYPAIIGVHSGDWHGPLGNYSKWVHTWYRHVDTPEWFKDIFNINSVHDYRGNSGFEKGFYSKEKGMYIANERIKKGHQLLEWAFWWEYPEDVEVPWENLIRKFWYGDYYYPAKRGGLKSLKDEIKKCQEKGSRVNLYMEATLCWKDTDIGKRMGKRWARMDAPGIYNRDYCVNPDDGWMMCLFEEGWQEHVANTFGKIIEETGVDGLRLDRTAVMFPCFNKEHHHYNGTLKSSVSASSYANLYKIVRRAIKTGNPDSVLLGEYAGSDYLTQFFDGSTAQQLNTAMEIKQPAFFNTYDIVFFRFYFPEFKLWNWSYYYDSETWKKINKSTFFNGMGINSSDLSSEEEIDYLFKTGEVLKENGDAFASLNPVPMINTIPEYVYANKFPVEKKVVYTIYNKNNSMVSGKIINVEHVNGYHYLELLYDDEVSSVMNNNIAALSLPINSMDVVCIAQLPEIIETKMDRDILRIRLQKIVNSPVLKIFVNEDEEENGREISVQESKAEVNLEGINKDKKIIIKLFEDKYLIDEKIIRQ